MTSKSYIKTFLTLCLIQGCVSQRASDHVGILTGITGVFEGNCMPSPGQPPCEAQPISATVLITSPSEIFDFSILVDSVVSDENGVFKITLSAGKYSLFLRDGDKVGCEEFQCEGSDCICTPFIITEGTITTLNPNIDRASW